MHDQVWFTLTIPENLSHNAQSSSCGTTGRIGNACKSRNGANMGAYDCCGIYVSGSVGKYGSSVVGLLQEK